MRGRRVRNEPPAASHSAAAPVAQYPVGLRVLRLWGFPLRRSRLVRPSASALLFPLAASVILIATIYTIGLLLAWHEQVLPEFIANPLVPALLLAIGWSAVWISWASSAYERWGLRSELASTDATTGASDRK